MRGFRIHSAFIKPLAAGHKVTDRKLRLPYFRPTPRQATPGEIMFVQESFTVHQCDPKTDPLRGHIVYRADTKHCPSCGVLVKPVSAVCMPVQLSRFTIQITSIEATVLQRITPAEVVEEGFWLNEYGLWTTGYDYGMHRHAVGHEDPVEAYALTWDYMMTPTGPFWCDTETAVWKFGFKVVDRPEPMTGLARIANLDQFLARKTRGKKPPRLIIRDSP